MNVTNPSMPRRRGRPPKAVRTINPQFPGTVIPITSKPRLLAGQIVPPVSISFIASAIIEERAAMNKPFGFSDEQRASIEAPLRRRGHPAALCREYIRLVEIEITEWQHRWPPVNKRKLADNRRHYRELEKHLTQVHYNLSVLDDDYLIPIWARLHDRAALFQTLPPAAVPSHSLSASIRSAGERTHLMLIELLHVVKEQIEADADRNSRNTVRKAELVKGIAATYHGHFSKRPTTTRTGAFMEVVTAIGEALGEPIGKDATASALADWHRERTFHFEVDTG
jgi:hypothetical protein